MWTRSGQPRSHPRSITSWRFNTTWRTHRGDTTINPTDAGDRIARAATEAMAVAGRDLPATLNLGGIQLNELGPSDPTADLTEDHFMAGWSE